MSPRGRRRPLVPLVTVLATTGLLVAACAGPSSSGGPSAPGPVTTSRSATATPAAPPAATMGSSSSGSSPTPGPDRSATPAGTGPDVLTYHGDRVRSGQESAAPLGSPARAWSRDLDGAVYAQPLLITAGGRQTLVVATEANTLWGLDPVTGAVRWHTAPIGTPVTADQLPCGNIDPLGITGTPVFQRSSGLVLAVAEVSDDAGIHHVLVGVSPITGEVAQRRDADPPGQDPTVEQQRSALLAVGTRVYVAYGGLAGDCGDYHGYVVGIDTATGARDIFQTPSTREAGIWAPPGPVADADGGLYVAVGNGEATGGEWDHSDSVLRLSPRLALLGGFAPARWPEDNAADLDLGSTSPTLLPHGIVYADGKSPTAYTMRAGALGGVGSELARAEVCASYGGTAFLESTIYVPCRDGVRAVSIGQDGSIGVGWHAAHSVNGSPVVSGALVFVLDQDNRRLVVLDRATGERRADVEVGEVTRFATPVLSGTRAFVATTTGVVAVGGV